MDTEQKNNFNEVLAAIKKPEYFIPRNYQSIGGMWTVDTWQMGDVSIQLMDEGYTTVLQTTGLRVVSGFNGENYLHIEKGTPEALADLAKQFKKQTTPKL
jgi:hypothetical protein